MSLSTGVGLSVFEFSFVRFNVGQVSKICERRASRGKPDPVGDRTYFDRCPALLPTKLHLYGK